MHPGTGTLRRSSPRAGAAGHHRHLVLGSVADDGSDLLRRFRQSHAHRRPAQHRRPIKAVRDQMLRRIEHPLLADQSTEVSSQVGRGHGRTGVSGSLCPRVARRWFLTVEDRPLFGILGSINRVVDGAGMVPASKIFLHMPDRAQNRRRTPHPRRALLTESLRFLVPMGSLAEVFTGQGKDREIIAHIRGFRSREEHARHPLRIAHRPILRKNPPSLS